ncbi:MAG TPA: 5'/3'-nucleotidase SurE [Firmicutes bacterium]|nr:5'/3'-nucleotidase SurE [Bacillota bacterium]
MKFLLTNDDGIKAPGISSLTRILSQFGEVYVVAPHENNSAVGHGITMRRPLKQYADNILHASYSVGIDGTPADCVKYALSHLKIKPDIVFSGINDERNCGTDVLYSGTVSGAIEANLCGYPAIAVSTTNANFDVVEKYLPSLLEKLLAKPFNHTFTYNINFPEGDNVKGVKVTTVGISRYEEAYIESDGGHKLSGPFIDIDQPEDTDVKAVLNGYITISPLKFKLYDEVEMSVLEKILK